MRRSRFLLLFAGVVLVVAFGFAARVAAPRAPNDERDRAKDANADAHSVSLSVDPEPESDLDPGRAELVLAEPAGEGVFFSDLKGSATPLTPLVTVADAGPACPSEMIDVEGDYCLYVEQRCLHFIDYEAKPPLMCQEFAASSGCYGLKKHLHFCIDRYEWPNRVGVLPAYSLTWMEARASCVAAGKRLCLDNEWTLACEGNERLPYPYGFTRNDDACNIDQIYRTPNPERYINLPTRADELARLDQREPSGSREACVSPYGVHDMAGNVDEWVVNYTGQYKPHVSGLKGGYWGPIRGRCRPMTTIHDENFHYYQVGFRCCADSAGASSGQ